LHLLYHRGHCLLQQPLARRREVLAEACRRLEVTEVSFSEAVVGPGTALYAAALARGHEGVVAKHLGSAYRPGRRSPAWRKIKPRAEKQNSPSQNDTRPVLGTSTDSQLEVH
jgi:ATP-dependent DNA ligase